MIQRIQTVYLLAATVLVVLAMSFPLGYFYSATSFFVWSNLSLLIPDGRVDYASWPLFLLLQIVAVLSLVAIFLFKKRPVQIKLIVFAMIVTVGYYVLLSSYIWGIFRGLGKFHPTWMLCFPLLSLILNYMAMRAIKKDEALVKSYDRLR